MTHPSEKTLPISDSDKACNTPITLGVINLVIVGVGVALFFSPLGRKPGAIHPFLVPFFLYILLSFIPPLFGLFYALRAIRKKKTTLRILIGTALNATYLIVYFLLLFKALLIYSVQ